MNVQRKNQGFCLNLDVQSLHTSYLPCTQCLVAVAWLGRQKAPNHIKLFTIGVRKSFKCNSCFIALRSWPILATSAVLNFPYLSCKEIFDS